MASFKAVVRKQRADGLYTVYIRVVHKSDPGYIKTNKVVSDKFLTAKKEIKDPVVNEYCSRVILEYVNKLNLQDISQMSVSEVIEYLTIDKGETSFSEYAKKHIMKMKLNGQARTAKNYEAAVKHLEGFIGHNNLMFGQLSSTVLTKWIERLSQTNRAKEMYPVCVRQIFKAAINELNDEERGICRIPFNPWLKVKIPKADKGAHKAISAEACREFFNRPLPKTKMISSLPELGRDVAMLSLCLGGMNTADLYLLKKTDYYNGVIHYKRAKIRTNRNDEGYFEIRVEPFILPLVEKYMTPEDDEFLFSFHNRYCDFDSFNANVNNGIRKICDDMKLPPEQRYCVYTFRHTWGTIAQNDCGANLFEVAFGMNHSHGLKVTRGYVRLDFTPAWELNAKVIDFIFFSDKKSKQGQIVDFEVNKDALFRLSPKVMVYARAYFKGKVIAEFTDIGYGTVNAVIKKLVEAFPSTIPEGGAVQFRITNCDSQKEVVYERTKGKGF